MAKPVDGMTDLQFKAYVRLLLLALEQTEAQDTVEGMRSELAKLKAVLQSTLQG